MQPGKRCVGEVLSRSGRTHRNVLFRAQLRVGAADILGHISRHVGLVDQLADFRRLGFEVVQIVIVDRAQQRADGILDPRFLEKSGVCHRCDDETTRHLETCIREMSEICAFASNDLVADRLGRVQTHDILACIL